ncbi:hypothetical protein GT037_010668 [Alternaria burnsii]|uniref:DUF7918 domain-containing protein n=1 Tax=Alternaria burnsii TaxID=1187904 RepID=A0A8H7ATL2_9PLEO|nr:uncharacterized protein GT037_010668 [Alternaria burnsii]KAF7671343.1 hypothetical protein GT037_010668 [Alternaria burnsii]
MPSLKDLNCAIEVSESQQALQEFGTTYGDGCVETFIPVPSKPQTFSIHLTSNKFIAPGVAIFVYVDGVYQCNRNRQDLKLRKHSDSRSLVDFRVRQKEERQDDGSMFAREWAFDKLNIASADDAPNLCSPDVLQNIGCIEVVVLRCAGIRNAKSASTMNFDGAGDYPKHLYDFDDTSSPPNERSMYDDRGPFFTPFDNGYGPPPPISSHHPPYVETSRSQEGSTSRSRRTAHSPHDIFPPAPMSRRSGPRSRYSEAVSPGARTINDLSLSGVQYGSGPIPRDREICNNQSSGVRATQPPAMDPMWLNNLLATAVKQGVEESRRMDTQSEHQTKYKIQKVDAETPGQPPGAWPESPLNIGPSSHRPSEPAASSSRNHESAHGSQWDQSQAGWSERKARSRAGTRVTWIETPVDETTSSSADRWTLRDKAASDSWDTGDTWPTDRVAEWETSSQNCKAWAPSQPSHRSSVRCSSISPRSQERRSSKHDSQRRARSKSRTSHRRRKYETTTEDEEQIGVWDHIKRPLDSVVSLSSSDATMQPSLSRSRTHTPRRRSKSLSRRSKSTQREKQRKSSRHSHRTPTEETVNGRPAPVPSVDARLAPVVMNAPIPATSHHAQSEPPSIYADPSIPVMQLPEWASQVHDATRKSSIAASTLAPAPYAPSLKDFVQSTKGKIQGGYRSSSSSSWGNDKNDSAVNMSWGKATKKDAGWGKKSDTGWHDKGYKDNDKKGWFSTDGDSSSGWAKGDDDETIKVANGWNTKETGWGTTAIPPIEKKHGKNDLADLKSTIKSAFENPSAPEAAWKNQSRGIPRNTAKPATQQATPTPFTTVAAQAPPPSKQPQRMSNKTLAQYRPNHPFSGPAPSPTQQSERLSNKSLANYRPNHPSLSSPTPISAPQPHWQFPPPPSTSLPANPVSSNSTYIAPELPRLTISQRTATAKGVEHAVRAGRATHYGHAVGRPQYLDGLDKPYAVFRFKYRSVSVLRGMFGRAVDDERIASSNQMDKGEKEEEEDGDKGKVKAGYSQDELITRMTELERKVKDVGVGAVQSSREPRCGKVKKKEQRRVSAATESVAKKFTEQWVERHSRDSTVTSVPM